MSPDLRRLAPKTLRPYMTKDEAEDLYLGVPTACFIAGIFLMFAPWAGSFWWSSLVSATLGGTIGWLYANRVMKRVRIRMERERLPKHRRSE